MALADAFIEIEPPGTGRRNCKTCRWYSHLAPNDKEFFDLKVADPDTNLSTLRQACANYSGLNVVASSFRHHIREHHALLKAQEARR